MDFKSPFAAALFVVAFALQTAGCASTEQTVSPSRCVAVPVPTDSQDITCFLHPSARGHVLRFEAVFGGSHDDTRITLEARLDDASIACDAGSKTSLFAEDGIVRLDCRFRVHPSVVDTAAPAPVLKVALVVHHAQYMSSSLLQDR